MPFFGDDNAFMGFLDENPNIAYQSFAPDFGVRSPNQQRFFQNSFQSIHDQFLGRLGNQIRQGQAPTANFTDFLGNFDFGGFSAAQSPWMRGQQTQRFAPTTRWLTNF